MLVCRKINWFAKRSTGLPKDQLVCRKINWFAERSTGLPVTTRLWKRSFVINPEFQTFFKFLLIPDV
jgi:hypothetical protein